MKKKKETKKKIPKGWNETVKEQMMMKKKEEVPVGGVFPFGRRRRRGQHFGQLLSSPCQVPVISIVTDTATLLASRDHLLLLVTCYRIENIPFSGLLAGCRMLLFPTLAGVSFQFLLWTQKKMPKYQRKLFPTQKQRRGGSIWRGPPFLVRILISRPIQMA